MDRTQQEQPHNLTSVFTDLCTQEVMKHMDYKGSTEEKKARLFLANLGIDYDALTMEQFANLIEVLKLSKHMNSPISQRGKGSTNHGKGKRKRK